MATPVTMPMLGLTMEEGTVAEWLKHEGDTVRKDEPLLMVEMDKGTVEVPSPASGVLSRIVVQPGQTVAIKTVIAEIGAPADVGPPSGPLALSDAAAVSASPAATGASAPSAASAASATALGASAASAASAESAAAVGASAGLAPAGGPGDLPAAAQVTPEMTPEAAGVTPSASPGASHAGAAGGRLFASPRARLRAREWGIDLAGVRGSGPNGRIVEDDVLQASVTSPQASVTAVSGEEAERVLATPLARRLALEHGVSLEALRGSGPGGRITQEDVLAAAEARQAAPGAVDGQTAAAGEVQPLSRVRRITAERMLHSSQAVARVTLTLEADFSEAARFRQQLQPEFARLGVPKLPWDALIARAAGLALVEHPAIAAQWVEGQGLRRTGAIHVGVAVALQPEGLVVPVLRDAATRSLRELSADLLRLVELAQVGRLTPGEMQAGSFTITNLGQYRVDGFTPIINPPETAILGVGRIALKPAVVEGRVEARTQCTLSLSFDHRAVDGAPAAAFLARLAELLERPYTLLGI